MLTPDRERCDRPQSLLLESDDGAVAILVVLTITVLLALAALTVDAGAFYTERRRLQTSADAAALAGVQNLPDDTGAAAASANQYAVENSDDAKEVEPVIGSTYVSNDTITVTVRDPSMGLFFARFVGRDTTRVDARAKAVVGSPSSYARGVMPFGVMAKGSSTPPYGLVDGENTVLHTDPKDSSNGNFHMVDFDKSSGYSSANNAKGVIAGGGTTASISIGAVIDTQPGNVMNPDYTALEGYFTCSHTQADLDASYDADRGVYTLEDSPGVPCRRIIVCPVVAVPGYDWEVLNGKSTPVPMTVVGFAQYFVESTAKGTLYGRFVQTLDPDALDPGGYVPWAGVLYWLDE